jgi:hypothetical protein
MRKKNSLRDLKAIRKQAFEDDLKNGKKCWEQCISSGGGSPLRVIGEIYDVL